MWSFVESLYMTTLIAGPVVVVGLIVAASLSIASRGPWTKRMASLVTSMAVTGYMVAFMYMTQPANHLIEGHDRGTNQTTMSLHVEELGVVKQYPKSDVQRQSIERRVMGERLAFVAGWLGLAVAAASIVHLASASVVRLRTQKR